MAATSTLDNLTRSAEFLSELGFDLLSKIGQRSNVGSLAIGTGTGSIGGGQSSTTPSLTKGGSMHVYFYNTAGTGLNASGLPDFINNDLTVNNAALIGYVGNLTVSDAAKLKEGYQLDRSGEITLGRSIGQTFKIDQGYGTGNFNCMAVCSCDLLALVNRGVNEPRVFFGRMIDGNGNSNSPVDSGLQCFLPGIGTLTDANTILVNRGNVYFTYNLVTGDWLPYTGALSGYDVSAVWATNQIVLGNFVYYLAYSSTSQYDVGTGIWKRDLTTGARTSGWKATTQYMQQIAINLVKVGTDLYISEPTDATKITLTMIDPTNMGKTATTQVVNIPVVWQNGNASITSHPDGSYLMTFANTGITFKFTNLADPQASCQRVFFTGSSTVAPIVVGTETKFLANAWNGLINDIPSFNNLAFNMRQAIIDGEATPLLSWQKFAVAYAKSSTTELSSSHYFKGYPKAP